MVYGDLNMPVACGARVVACEVESSYLSDEEARLVRCITGIPSTVPRPLFKRNRLEPESSHCSRLLHRHRARKSAVTDQRLPPLRCLTV
jgi:hypothetical protein